MDRRSLLVVAGVVAVDQATKIGYHGRLNSFVPGTDEDGDQSFAHLGLIVVLLAAFVAWFPRRPWWAYGLALGGLLSNAVDRFVFGGVRDPIAFGPAWWNLADAAALAGLAVCVGTLISDSRREVNGCIDS
jgi:lipoprotein signal peptidase